ncbi:MAG: hypothetical protein JWN83_2595 [Chitinophagaceae bacterium]|nr:hypothetical protein [Chitinophagaceae bacterium]
MLFAWLFKMKKNRPLSNINFLIPANLNIDEVILKNSFAFKGNNLKRHKLLFVCDYIIKARIAQRKEMNDKDTDYAEISSRNLNKILHDHSKYLNFLLKAGVIETDNYFILGEKCKGFRFKYKYSGTGLKQVLLDNFQFKRAIQRDRERRKQESKKSTWGYGYLTKWWDDNKLHIDAKGACLWIDNYTDSKIQDIKNDEAIKYKLKPILNAKDTAIDFQQKVYSLNEGNHYYKFVGDNHRFYNPITNIKRELRNFLTYDGEQLVSIDLKNSQPYLSIAFFKKEFWSNADSLGENLNLKYLNKEIYNDIRRKEEYNNIITLVSSLENYAPIDSDVNNYISQVVAGTFYEYIQLHFQSIYPKKFDSREKVKKEVLTILFIKPQAGIFYSPCQTFKVHFSTPYELYTTIKSVQYNYLPIILQRIESFLMIDIICKKITEINSEIPLFTIHDSIITTVGNEGLIEAIMKNELEYYIGYKPTLKIEYLRSSESSKKSSLSLSYNELKPSNYNHL